MMTDSGEIQDLDDDVPGDRPCAGCDHDPACGYASTWTEAEGEQWWCHADDHSCYVTAGQAPPSVIAPLTWPDTPVGEWDDLDRIIAQIVHERDCQRWPHWLMRRVEVHRTSAWNRWVRVRMPQFGKTAEGG